MRSLLLVSMLSCLILATVSGQTPPEKSSPTAPAESTEIRATRHSFMLVSTHAIALFQSADSIEARLHAEGSSLHPGTVTLRLRIEHTLDQAEAAMNKGEWNRAKEEIKVAGELVNRFSRRIGGE